MKQYSVNQLAKLAGISVRALHHYDRLGLLTPSVRTGVGYRKYGEKELLRLQQILFYKELGFSLAEILTILDDPDFDRVAALHQHRQALEDRRNRLTTLLGTIDKTIAKLNGKTIMMTEQDLYAGFPDGKGESYRREAAEKYGADVVVQLESRLRTLTKTDFSALTAEGTQIASEMESLMHLDLASDVVQQQVARHYANIRQFWGESVCKSKNMADTYKGLASLYISDLRFTTSYIGQEDPAYATFFGKAMLHFADKLAD